MGFTPRKPIPIASYTVKMMYEALRPGKIFLGILIRREAMYVLPNLQTHTSV